VTPAGRFQCAPTLSDEPPCTTYARVTIGDTVGDSARGCVRHAVQALEGIDGARVDWADSRGLNEFERKALELTEEITRHRAAADVEAEPDPQAEAEL
jgi:hypothetical protein